MPESISLFSIRKSRRNAKELCWHAKFIFAAISPCMATEGIAGCEVSFSEGMVGYGGCNA
jgi:hypothetical protein